MPGFLLHVGAVVQCVHGDMAQPTVPNPRVKVMGQPIVTQPGTYVISGCAFPPPPAAGQSGDLCTDRNRLDRLRRSVARKGNVRSFQKVL